MSEEYEYLLDMYYLAIIGFLKKIISWCLAIKYLCL